MVLKTDSGLGQVHLTGPLSLWLEDKNSEDKHLSSLLGRSDEMMNVEELCK